MISTYVDIAFRNITKGYTGVTFQMILINILKVVSATFLLVCFLGLKASTFETRKNVVYFTSKAIFVFEIIKFKCHDVIKCLSMKHETHIE